MACPEVAVITQLDMNPTVDGFFHQSSPQHSWGQPISPQMSPHYVSVHSPPMVNSPFNSHSPAMIDNSPLSVHSPIMSAHSPVHCYSPGINVKQETVEFDSCTLNNILSKPTPPELVPVCSLAPTVPFSAADGKRAKIMHGVACVFVLLLWFTAIE